MLLSKLCRANSGILTQKVGLINALVARHGGDTAKELYQSVCPMVGASIGQHIRHSMDHMELAILVAQNPPVNAELHYDLRVRGGTLETDMDEAKKRLLDVQDVLQNLAETSSSDQVVRKSVKANFFLSAEPVEYELESTLGRELGFAAHHAIHHMALIKLIATNHAGLDASDLPDDFGRAPCTVANDRAQQQ